MTTNIDSSSTPTIWLGNPILAEAFTLLQPFISVFEYRKRLAGLLLDLRGDRPPCDGLNRGKEWFLDTSSTPSAGQRKLLSHFQAASLVFRDCDFNEVLGASDLAFGLGNLNARQSLSLLPECDSALFVDSVFSLLTPSVTSLDQVDSLISFAAEKRDVFGVIVDDLIVAREKLASLLGMNVDALPDPIESLIPAYKHCVRDDDHLNRYCQRVKDIYSLSGLNDIEAYFALHLPDLLIGFSLKQAFPAAVTDEPLELLSHLFISCQNTLPEWIRSSNRQCRRTRLRPLLFFLLSGGEQDSDIDHAIRNLTLTMKASMPDSAAEADVGRKLLLPGLDSTANMSKKRSRWVSTESLLPRGTIGTLSRRRIVHTGNPSEFCFRFID